MRQDPHEFRTEPINEDAQPQSLGASRPYQFAANHPYDRSAPIRMAVPQGMASQDFMQSIRELEVPSDALAIWFLGQNGFILKDASGVLIAIDPYLSDSCASSFSHLPFRLNRQLPIFIEPEHLHVDFFITTHSHEDHADPETLRRVPHNSMQFIGSWQCLKRYREAGIPMERCRAIHPSEEIALHHSVRLRGTFALPTDDSDLNHMGVLLQFLNGITFYNTGDTGYCNLLSSLLPRHSDLCAICINGGFHNLDAMRAADLVKAIDPRVAIPCHYDMMINNTADPLMFRTALDVVGSSARCVILPYYEPWLYRRDD